MHAEGDSGMVGPARVAAAERAVTFGHTLADRRQLLRGTERAGRPAPGWRSGADTRR
jgi:hypothetical protein